MALCNAMIGLGKALAPVARQFVGASPHPVSHLDGVGADGPAQSSTVSGRRGQVAAAELLTAGAVAAADCCGCSTRKSTGPAVDARQLRCLDEGGCCLEH